MAQVCDWSVDECYEHLFDQPWVEKDFVHQLREQAVDGQTLLELTKDDLREDFGIQKLGHVKMILRHIQRLNAEHSLNSTHLANSTLMASTSGLDTSLNTTQGGVSAINDSSFAHEVSQISMFPMEESMPIEINATHYNTPPLGGRRKVPKRFQAAHQRPPLKNRAGGLQQSTDFGGLIEAFANSQDASPLEAAHRRSQDRLPEIGDRRSATSQGFYEEEKAQEPPRSVSSQGFQRDASTSLSRSQLLARPPTPAGLDLEGAKSKGRKSRPREDRDREERMDQGEFGQPKFEPGLLEVQRRVDVAKKVFEDWVGKEDDASVESTDIQDILKLFAVAGQQEDFKQAEPSPDDTPESYPLGLEQFISEVVDTTKAFSPTIYDDFISFFYVAIGDREPEREAARRRALFAQLFDILDVDQSGNVDQGELRGVLVKLNEWMTSSGEGHVQFDVAKYDSNENSLLEGPEFVQMMYDLSEKFGTEDFDMMYFRLGRCVDVVRTAGNVAKDPAFKKELKQMARREYSGQPMLLYGVNNDPSRSIEELAKEFGTTVQGLVVSNLKAEANAIQAIKHAGMVRGKWIYVVIFGGYANTDAFVRSVALALLSKELWLVHKKFRLFISYSDTTIHALPQLFLKNCIPLALDN